MTILHGFCLHPWHDQLVWSFAGDCRICSPTFVMDLFPYPFLHRVAGHTPSASATYSSGSMSSLVLPLMPTSKQWLISLVVHYKYIISNILTNMQYPMHAIQILMHFMHKLRKCSYNQQDRVLRKTSLSNPSSWHGTPCPHNSWLTSQSLLLLAFNCPDLSIW